MPTNEHSLLGTGSQAEYQWLTATGHSLDALLERCPQTVLNKYVVITAFDSSPLALDQDEIADGWRSQNGVAYSPRVQSVEKLPHDEWDEWYVFPSAVDLGLVAKVNQLDGLVQPGQLAVFVNFGAFGLHTLGHDDLFWQQLESIHPESYIADGDLLNFVSCDQELFQAVRSALS